MRAAIYVRRSKKRNGATDTHSIEQQETESRAVVKQNGWELADVYVDNDLSASKYAKKGRPSFDRLEADVRAGRIDVVVLWEQSRLTRKLATFTDFRDLCEKHGVKWSVSGTTYDLSEPDHQSILGINAVLAESETSRNSKRIKRHVRAQAKTGRPHGRTLYGYQRVHSESTGKLIEQVLNVTEAAIVREVFDRFLTGDSTGAIARDLNNRGIASPSSTAASVTARREAIDSGVAHEDAPALEPSLWRISQIKRMLTNPAYAKLRVHQGEIIGEALWDQIITRGERNAVLSRLDDPSRRASANQSEVKYLMTGIVRCGRCGGTMGRGKEAKIRTNGEIHNVYVCKNRKPMTADVQAAKKRGDKIDTVYKIGHLVRRMDWVDEYVTEILLDRLSMPDAIGALTGAGAAEDETLGARLGEADELQRRLDEATASFIGGTLTIGTLNRIEADLAPRIASLRAEARKSYLPGDVFDLAKSDPEAVTRIWADLPIRARREIVSTLVDVTIKPSSRPRGSRGFEPNDVEVAWRLSALSAR